MTQMDKELDFTKFNVKLIAVGKIVIFKSTFLVIAMR